ncbi:MAG: hypothetical protein IKA64_07580, partial [Clostridia bacterium]|nr:hypothetical protein [Clostridia bacterium]
FLYDAEGSPIGIQHQHYSLTNPKTYWFEKNLQGDVVAVYRDSDAVFDRISTYEYDAWGNIVETWHTSSILGIGEANPFRYRGYYYDVDTGLYYLNSRYYDPSVCRFISPDSSLYHGMIGYNMYAYCNNNSINFYDPTGESAQEILNTWTSSMWWLHWIDGALPIGDIIYWGAAAFLGVAMLGEHIHNATSSADSKTQDVPKSIEEPRDSGAVDDDGNPVVLPGQQPTEKEGYIMPKNGPVKGKTKKREFGWKDKNGNIWVPAPTGSKKGHGGGHWDVQSPKGGYINVYPGGKVRGGKLPYPNIGIFPR